MIAERTASQSDDRVHINALDPDMPLQSIRSAWAERRPPSRQGQSIKLKFPSEPLPLSILYAPQQNCDYSITSSAMDGRSPGTVRPSARATARLTTRSNF